jgi:hypothetical protein
MLFYDMVKSVCGVCCTAVVCLGSIILVGNANGMDNDRLSTDADRPVISVTLNLDSNSDEDNSGKGYLVLGIENRESGKWPYYYWSNTKEKASLEEAILFDKQFKDRLPVDNESFQKYYSRYDPRREDELINCGFTYPVRRMGIELEFCCIEGRLPTHVFETIRSFCNLLIQLDDESFKNYMICYIFDCELGSAFYNLEKIAQKCRLSRNDLLLEYVKNETNTLLDLVDPNQKSMRIY